MSELFNSFYNFIKHPEWHISFWGYIKWNLLNRSCPIMQAWAYLKNVFHFYKIRNLYINQLKSLW